MVRDKSRGEMDLGEGAHKKLNMSKREARDGERTLFKSYQHN